MPNRFPSLRLVRHSLLEHKLSLMRDKDCPSTEFSALMKDIGVILACELSRDLPLAEAEIETPVAPVRARLLSGKAPVIVAVLRAGLGLADGLYSMLPMASRGHIGLYRDHVTLRPVEYLRRLPEPEGRFFIIADPMLATGNSACHAVDVLVRHGVSAADIVFVAVVVAPEGIARFARDYPDIPVYTAALDSHLNEHAYIVPGLGDAGDRTFGTL
jgi:uracil phosphoribosyltransferase